MSDSIRHLTDELIRLREDRGWGPEHTPKNLAASVAIEAGELLECFQWSDEPSDIDAVAFEMADVMIYLLNLAEVCGIDLGEAIERKIARNNRRYPVAR